MKIQFGNPELYGALLVILFLSISIVATSVIGAQVKDIKYTSNLSVIASSDGKELPGRANMRSVYEKGRGFVGSLFNKTSGIVATIVALVTGLVYLLGLWNQNPGLRTEPIEDTNDILSQPFHIENTSEYFAMRDVRAAIFIPLAVVTPDGMLSPRFADTLGNIPPSQSVVFDCRPLCDPFDHNLRKKIRAPNVREYSAPEYAVVIGIEWRLFGIKRHKTWTLGVNSKPDGSALWVVKRISRVRLENLDDLKMTGS